MMMLVLLDRLARLVTSSNKTRWNTIEFRTTICPLMRQVESDQYQVSSESNEDTLIGPLDIRSLGLVVAWPISPLVHRSPRPLVTCVVGPLVLSSVSLLVPPAHLYFSMPCPFSFNLNGMMTDATTQDENELANYISCRRMAGCECVWPSRRQPNIVSTRS